MKENKQVPTLVDFLRQSRLTHNMGLKIFSILFAIVFWVYVMDQVNPMMVQTKNHIKVELLNRPIAQQNGLMLMSDDNYFVDVTIEGRRNDLLDISKEDIVVTADLDGYGKGKSSIPLQATSTAENVNIVDISKKDIKAVIDAIVEIQKPIELDVAGKPQEGYVQGKLSLTPHEVLVTGPETYVNSVASLSGTINLDGIAEGVTTKIPVKPVDNDGNLVRGVNLGENYVQVHLDIWKGQDTKVKTKLRGDIKRGYALVDVKTIPEIVAIQGETKVIEQIKSINTVPIDISELSQSMEIRVGLELPDRVVVEPSETVLVKLDVRPLETKIIEIAVKDVIIENIPDGFVLSDEEIGGNVSVVVEDIVDILETLNESDFVVTADMSEAKAGKYQKVSISIEPKKEVRRMSIVENRLSIPIVPIVETEQNQEKKDNDKQNKVQ